MTRPLVKKRVVNYHFGVNFFPYHGHRQFNNSLESQLLTRKYLDKLSSIYDLNLFTLNTNMNLNPDLHLLNQHIRSHYYSPHSFNIFKLRLSRSIFSLLHTNITSMKRLPGCSFEFVSTPAVSGGVAMFNTYIWPSLKAELHSYFFIGILYRSLLII